MRALLGKHCQRFSTNNVTKIGQFRSVSSDRVHLSDHDLVGVGLYTEVLQIS